MRSSSGAYYVGLDHLRALAAFLVFEWHFIHGTGGAPVPFDYAPSFPPAVLIAQGHVGVALFMTLSGYLFAKLLHGAALNYSRFLWNRALRLLPLLFLVFAIYGLIYRAGLFGGPSDLHRYGTYCIISWILGTVLPVWPNGGWSITCEFHFYIALPLILFLARRSLGYVALIICAAMLARIVIYGYLGEVQSAAYFTIIGRIDQFVLGVAAFQVRQRFTNTHVLIGFAFLAFVVLYWLFASAGSFAGTKSSPIWILLPTIEGAFFASLIAYYDTTYSMPSAGISGLVASAGRYSYSIYLLHPFYVFWLAATFAAFFPRAGVYVSIIIGAIAFAGSAALSSFTYHWFEAPFLRLRLNYTTAPGGNSFRWFGFRTGSGSVGSHMPPLGFTSGELDSRAGGSCRSKSVSIDDHPTTRTPRLAR